MEAPGGPGGLHDHTMVAHGASLYVLGGRLAGGPQLWAYCTRGAAWSCLEVGGGPPALRGHSASVWGAAMYVWGGLREVRGASAALWRLDLATLEWREEEQGGEVPPPRHGHAAALQGDLLYLHGGEVALRPSALLHRLHLPTLTWEQLPPGPRPSWPRAPAPPPTSRHALVPAGPTVLLLPPSGHCWAFSLASGGWRRGAPAPPRGVPVLLEAAGEENKAFAGEEAGEARPLPDLLAQVVTYRTEGDKVTLLPREVGGRKVEAGGGGRERRRRREVCEVLVVGGGGEEGLPWVREDLRVWKGSLGFLT